MKTIRLDKFLSSQLGAARSEVKKYIRAGRVRLGETVSPSPETRLDPAADAVYFDGERIRYQAFVYLMLNKPGGVVSATRDRQKTVLDLVPPELYREGLFPAGRLDKDTTGLMILTDDGAFAHRILSPSRHIEKAYEVTVTREVTPAERDALLSGVRLGDELLKAAALTRLDRTEPVYEIVLTQGRYHQIRRMFGSQKNPVSALRRTRMGGLVLDAALGPGECRSLTPEEVRAVEERAV